MDYSELPTSNLSETTHAGLTSSHIYLYFIIRYLKL